MTNARIIVSGALEVFPGTGERVVLISGNINSVDLAQTLVWEMIAQNVQSGSDRSVDWSPEVVVNNLGVNDSVDVKAKITIPAAVGGLILGRGGETIKDIAAESGASIVMTRFVTVVIIRIRRSGPIKIYFIRVIVRIYAARRRRYLHKSEC